MVPALINVTPDPIAIQIGPLPLAWYGIAYAVGLLASYRLLIRQAVRAGQDPAIVGNGIVVVAIAALIGGRLYHVIDQWQLYSDCLIRVFIPIEFESGCSGPARFAGFSGLGVYGGLVSGTIAAYLTARYYKVSFPVWAGIIAPALFLMQAIGRWGNFFNQELYGPPTSLPWGIAIDCAHRIAAYPCSTFPEATTGFQPLFLYESLSGLLGMAFLLWLEARHRARLRPGDLLLIFFMWYGAARFGLEFLRQENWTLNGIPTAQIFSTLFAVGALAIFVGRRIVGPRPPGGRQQEA
ncbi:MAG: prolipoprotein diacylglyceryl transferase, partial [Chloroflexi bacterium]|nr:prolipoprotein diacylglyceryl transferase [Chloroflexota bacterium]